MTEIALSLEAVIVALTDERPRLLTVSMPDGMFGIPSGPLDVHEDVTLERGLRRWVSHQTGLAVGYVEQLYTFGDRDRRGKGALPRLLSVAYLALVREEQLSPGAAWLDYYGLFPWEDHREGPPPVLEEQILPHLERWSAGDELRDARVRISFGVKGAPWDPIRALERYELLYEAELIEEAHVDRGRAPPPGLVTGSRLVFDHRRIAASALGRLRGKLTYRPVVFELVPDHFTLTQLQHTVEALVGVRMHKQNFRRLLERTGLVEGTGKSISTTGGRPAEMFRFRAEVLRERSRAGILRPRT